MPLPLPSPPRWTMMARRSACQDTLGGAVRQRRIRHPFLRRYLRKQLARLKRSKPIELLTSTRSDPDFGCRAEAEAARPSVHVPGPRPESTEPPCSSAPAADPRQAEAAGEGISVHIHIDTAGRRDHSEDITADLSDKEFRPFSGQ